jgi:hypothetical protein
MRGGTASEDLWYSYDDEIQRNMIVNIYGRELRCCMQEG